MWLTEEKRVPKPRYDGTVVCPNCYAEYNPDAKWCEVRYKEDTSGQFHKVGDIPAGCCPICRKERK